MDAAVQLAYAAAPRFGRHPDPEPLPGSSIVQVTAAPIVPLDLLCAGGTSYFGPPPLPYVPGVQGVGFVSGSSVHPAGTRVFFTTDAGMKPGDGSLAQLCSVRDEDVVVIDSDLADSAVAALGLSAVAGWMALSWRANLSNGETVLVLGAGGAVGQATIGAAHVLGAGRVVALCRSEASCQRAEQAGADRVVRMPTTPDLTGLIDELRTACAGSADVVIDPVFGNAAVAAMAVLAPGGRLVNLGGTAGDTATFSSSTLRSKSLCVLGYTNNSLRPEQRAEALTAVLSHAQSGRIAVQHTVLPLADCAAGWQLTAAGGTRVVLAP
jgi:NADPH:quinone reductase-like Zn-dependent oxidoreductase